MKPKIILILLTLVLSPLLMAYDCTGLPTGLYGRDNVQMAPVWSLDGSTIFFGTVSDAPPEGSLFAKYYKIYGVRADGSSLYSISVDYTGGPVSEVYSPSISPDGTRLAFGTIRDTRSSGSPEIGTSAVDGSDYRRLTDNDVTDINPEWSPDGTRIAFLSRRAVPGWDDGRNTFNIYTMAVDGSDVKLINSPSISVFAGHTLVWSPNGRHIAFLGGEADAGGPNPALYTISSEGGSATRVWEGVKWAQVHAPTHGSVDPREYLRSSYRVAWSPDGTRLAFYTYKYLWGIDTTVYTVAPDGSDLRKLIGLSEVCTKHKEVTLKPIPVHSLTWSEDASEIVAITDCYEEAGPESVTKAITIYGITVDGSDVRKIAKFRDYRYGKDAVAHSAIHSDFMVWSPDGSELAVYSYEGAFYGNSPFPARYRNVVLYTLEENLTTLRILAYEDDGLLVGGNGWQSIGDDINVCSHGFVVPDPENNSGLVEDCQMVLGARNALAGQEMPPGWSAYTPIDSWSGVEIGGTPRRVVGLSVTEGLRGELPRNLGNLTALQNLTLRGGISGTIPADLGGLGNLRVLDLSDNELTGEIPTELGALMNLRELRLHGNKLTGCIPQEVVAIPSLEELSHDGLKPC